MTRAIAIAGLLLVAGCDPEAILDNNSATLRFTTGEDDLELQHDPFRSTLSLSPPAAGAIELFFLHDDPEAELTLTLDGDTLAAGQTVQLPDPAVEVTGAFAGGLFRGAASGTVDLVVFEIDEELGGAALNAELDVTIAGDDGELGVRGFVDAVTN